MDGFDQRGGNPPGNSNPRSEDAGPSDGWLPPLWRPLIVCGVMTLLRLWFRPEAFRQFTTQTLPHREFNDLLR